jgi:hypothetical protein
VVVDGGCWWWQERCRTTSHLCYPFENKVVIFEWCVVINTLQRVFFFLSFKKIIIIIWFIRIFVLLWGCELAIFLSFKNFWKMEWGQSF